MIDVTFAVSPDFAVVAVQFERAAVVLVGVLFVGQNDRVASTIRLEVKVEKSVVGGIDDAEDTSVPDGFKHLYFRADAVEDSHIDAGNVLGLINVGHFSSF